MPNDEDGYDENPEEGLTKKVVSGLIFTGAALAVGALAGSKAVSLLKSKHAAEISKIDAELTTLQTQIDALYNEFVIMQARIKSKESEIITKKTRLATLRKELTEFKAECTEETQACDSIIVKINELQNTIFEIESKIKIKAEKFTLVSA